MKKPLNKLINLFNSVKPQLLWGYILADLEIKNKANALTRAAKLVE